MEFEGIIIEQLETAKGTNKETGEPWQRNRYVAESEERNPQAIVFDVWDGRDGRIARLNLEKGKKYKLFMSFEARKSKEGKWFNAITVWNARPIDDNEKGESENG